MKGVSEIVLEREERKQWVSLIYSGYCEKESKCQHIDKTVLSVL